MKTVARLAAHRSRLVVGVWLLLVVLLAMQGRGLDKELGIHPLLVNGSGAKRAHEIALHEFGNDYPMIVMLRGPQKAVERQGQRLADGIGATPPMLVISPWDAGGVVDGLNPKPGVAALLVRTASRRGDRVSGLLPPLQRLVDRNVRGPVHASIAGLPVIVNSIHDASVNAASLGELIAIPVLLVVLLFVFRSVLAAFTPLLIGGAVVVATRGVLSLLLHFVALDLFVLGISAMMGLALGVDYSLLVVSRFREERKRSEPAEAVQATVAATARSIIPAGGALLLAMLVAPVVLPGLLVRSVAIGVGVSTALSMISAICVVPALLHLFGRHLDRWALPARKSGQVAPLRWSRRIVKRPGAVIGLIFVLFVLSGLAFGLDSGIATAGLLPSNDPGRVQQEEIEDALGPGWVSPLEVIVNGRGTPVASQRRLREIADFQRHLERDPGVASIAGLIPIERGAKQLTGVEAELVKQEQGLDRLESGIARIGDGATRNTQGLVAAAEGSSGLEAGAAAANEGASALAGGLEKTSAGSSRLAEGLGDAGEGSGEIARGTAKATTGAGRIAHGLAQAAEQTGEIQGNARLFKNAMRSGQGHLEEAEAPLHAAEARLSAAEQALQRMTTGRGDAEYAAALNAVGEARRNLSGTDPGTGEATGGGVEAGLDGAAGQFEVGLYLAQRMSKNGLQASEGIGKLASASSRLDRGLQRLSKGSQRVSDGVTELARGGQQLSPALHRLNRGAERLSGGLGSLDQGAGQLSDGLREGAIKSRALPRSLDRIGNGLESQRGGSAGESQLALLRRRSPGLFNSAYFVLAALDGGKPQQRTRANALINVNRGGSTARLLVVPKDGVPSDAATATIGRLEDSAKGLARQTGAEVVVGGIGPANLEINNQIRDQSPIMRLVLALIGLLVLIPLMRSLAVPLLAVAINLLTVSASFGVLALLFNHSLLGGPGYIEATNIPATIMVIFGLAIDYEVFVFARIREEYLRTGSTRQAVELGLDRTAHVVTGAAMIMIIVFLSFAVSEFIPIRNFGVAQATAVFIDAFIVRLVIVPALMLWLGDRCWWMPRWLSWFRTPSRRSPALGEEG